MLVDYPESGSETDSQAENKPETKKKRKALDDGHVEVNSKRPPPLPSSFHSLYATNVRTSAVDDPTLHAGRTRQVPHVVGNWPTHLYLEWYPTQEELAILDQVVNQAGQTQNNGKRTCIHAYSFLRSDLGALQPLHISLSAPLVLQTDQREAFEEDISTRIARSRLKAFTVHVTGLDWVANHDKTRFFLVLKLGKPANNELNKFLSACNATAKQFELPMLYTDESTLSVPDASNGGEQQEARDRSDAFHISIAWTLEEPDEQARAQLAELDQVELQHLQVSFSLLKLKIGNIVNDISLTKHQDTEHG
ncbi:poly(U)-specific 3'-to-5' RNA exonuclease [Elasticomyces elasticus]|uniref:U6 snRNA phosphodiesterase n=1 Tax=Exophiala sideris TaxID=1016849 RepID=A0ABR0IXZ0_9EURO|nr:poly(U)-specific 3'-to-5' RNA exonuclease [Elasticomyces elasticus]KAK5022138.1 poly(U)-specific 3'-to-5' RNA exonuclease [Exophiala sideris]KAK5025057.1 poly(U)-specific 3'-to-5' RNA exonuclease [Exophiala sideris]KAK5051151.1 poly(U)-specific 3'-to-5' RNA exonuclease [Exophiala sideris]KAK5176816.1 poly(U)-specific 3'-to-5' RNA exonuclease [Eurotiomycetes sp. CCFEE 6388]